ncbi:hypothetical protein [Curvibacter soli]|uniref:hypothetical protein n=1 Tax=Curvibacter soli TaxID=3031331 RepID=UPI003AF127B6
MTDSDRLAIAAHLHVLLRRKTGRVTDTEWMAANGEYAAEVVRFSRAKAAEDNLPELAEWAAKLEQVMAEPRAARRAPLLQEAAAVLHNARPAGGASPSAGEPGHSSFGHSVSGGDSTFGSQADAAKRDPNSPRYVGGLR